MRGRFNGERPAGERGFVFAATAICIVALLGIAALSIDVARMYVAKSEAQAYTDAAALAAALELDGTTAGITRAEAAVQAQQAKWNLDTRSFTNTTVTFATSPTGMWVPSPVPATGYTYVKVRTSVDVGLYLMPVISHTTSSTVRATSAAAQVPKTSFAEGLFPFSPFAHNSTPPNFGLVPGQDYTLRWATNPKLTGNNTCPGDRTQAMIDIANAQGGSERGFIEDTSAAMIRATIEDDYQSITRTIGDLVTMTGGAKQSELFSLQNRINQDTDTTSPYYFGYHGNGRRIIAAPINDGGTPPGSNNRIVAIGAFFLHPVSWYPSGGGQCWCAEYIGSWVEGADHPGAGAPGAYVVRLVQ